MFGRHGSVVPEVLLLESQSVRYKERKLHSDLAKKSCERLVYLVNYVLSPVNH